MKGQTWATEGLGHKESFIQENLLSDPMVLWMAIKMIQALLGIVHQKGEGLESR